VRTRLSTRERSEQLLAIGAELFATRPYDAVSIDEVAEIAKVSRGLLYHYFATKREFFASVVRAEATTLLRVTEPNPALPVTEQLTSGLDAYLDYALRHRNGYLLLHRGAVAVDEKIREIVEDCLATQRQRILAVLHGVQQPSAATELAVRGWLAFVIAVCLEWLEEQTVSRTALRDLLATTLLAAVDHH
jgi:AcrR family transcriptional regulator